MDRILPSFWLLGAVLYTAAVLLLTQPFLDTSSGSLAATHETVVAKQMPALEPISVSPKLLENVSAVEQEQPQSSAETVSYPHNEWVAVVGYTAVVRADPSVSAPVLTAYPIGHALRVVERKGDFARIQDLSSGHYGWVAASAIAAYVPGYRERAVPLFQPTLVAETQTTVVPPKVTSPKAAQPAREVVAAAARPKQESVAVIEPADPPLVKRASLRPQRVAQNQADGGVAALVQRAFSGY
jgi:Bacterial SH3 domain